mgnify:CR=1 FL=1
MNTLRVRAVPGRKLPAVSPEGLPIVGRFVGYDRRGEILADSEKAVGEYGDNGVTKRDDVGATIGHAQRRQ